MATRVPSCPICGGPTEPRLRPFCSVRCADRDLRRWLTGGYAIASGGDDADEDGDDAMAARAPAVPAAAVDEEDDA